MSAGTDHDGSNPPETPGPSGHGGGRLQGARVTDGGGLVTITWTDGGEAVFHAIWLRDNCACPACRDPGNGQRLFDIAALPDAMAVGEAEIDGDTLALRFAPEGHRGRVDGAWLRAHRYTGGAQRERYGAPRRWGRELGDDLPVAEHDAVIRSQAEMGRWLGLIRAYGFSILRGVPRVPGEVARVAERFGFVRETNFGRIFEVVAKPAANDLAFTRLALGPHTDNPYRDPVPGLLLLHRLASGASGGISLVVDGFRAAERLRAEAPERFALLASHEVPFWFRDADYDIQTSAPIVTVDHGGAVTAIRYSNRTGAPLDVPADTMAAFYDAYRHFGRLLADAEAQVTFRLDPGDLLILDNRRVLHGRREFAADGARRLQGCYADRDALDSRWRKIAAA